MWRSNFRKIVSTVGAVCCVSFSTADTVVLHDGQTLSGRITGETPESITIDASAGRFTFPRSQVLRATKDSEIDNHRLDFSQLLSQGKIDAAMIVYQNTGLKKSMSDADLARSFLEQLRSTAAGAVASSPTATLLATKFQQSSSAPSETLILAAALLTDHEDYNTALNLLRLAEQRAIGPFIWPGDTLAVLLDRIANAAIRSENGSLIAASAALASRLPVSQATGSPNHLALYAQIEDLIRNGDFLRATALFHPDHFLHRADLFVPLAERLITAMLAAPTSNIIIPALESSTTTLLPYVRPDLRTQTYKALVNKLYDSGRAAQAQQIADQVSTQNPDMGAVLVHLVEFRRREAALADASPVDTYKLASWAKSMGLLEEAEGLFLSLRSDPRFTETVNMQLEIIDHAQAGEAVRRLRAMYDSNQINELKLQSTAFLKTSPPDKYAQEVRDLLQLADFEKWSRQHTSHGKAEAEFQHAERLANRGEYDEALTHLNQIQMEREKSAAAQKAQALRDRIMREKLRQSRKVSE